MKLEQRVKRDTENASRLPEAAKRSLGKGAGFKAYADIVRGTSVRQMRIAQHIGGDDQALTIIAERPFDAMLEAKVETVNGLREVLWYANKDIAQNQIISLGDRDVNVLAWTHAGFQIGLSGKLNACQELRRSGLAIRSVKPTARARFTQLTPSVAGLYDPGGQVEGEHVATKAIAGLKAVKLEMTPEQVQAFIARMNGVLVVTGAPGTGKTTIAFQRIRFLFDQQDQRDDEAGLVPYAPALTRVFLGSRNLIEYSRRLLRDELRVPEEVVSYAPDFIASYVDVVWQPRGAARPVTRQATPESLRAREALVSLCTAKDLVGMWATVERQARGRLKEWQHQEWYEILTSGDSVPKGAADALARALGAVAGKSTGEPNGSPVRMDALWTHARRPYAECRGGLKESQRDKFDRALATWLFWVFDPLDILAAYLGEHRAKAMVRVRRGTLGRVPPEKVFKEAIDDWNRRLYREQDLPWIGWVLRFALPEEAGQDDGFRGVPRAIPQPDHKTMRRWTHLVIDEAQDLAVPEASLLASFVHPRGALTVSADFHQVVSPVHGMTDGEALKFGLPIWDQKLHLQFPFQRNLRQSREIAQFLKGFYQRAFREFPPFDAGERLEGIKPQLYLGPAAQFPQLIKQMMDVFARSQKVASVAVLQVNDDIDGLKRLRTSLELLGIPLAPEDALFEPGKLILTSVERAKGLEFDACIVVGMDDVDYAAMNFAKNRAYVALSRPTRRLFMLCQTDPVFLHHIQRDLFERRTL